MLYDKMISLGSVDLKKIETKWMGYILIIENPFF